MVSLTTPGKKILWAVDAFPSHPEVSLQSLKAVKAVLEGIASSIEPVYVFRPPPPGLFLQAPPETNSHAEGIARKNIAKFVKAAKLSQITSPTFLHAEFSSTSSQVKCLLDHARRGQFDLILTGTHGRKGMPRLFMGSFAEKLIEQSELPVLVSSPNVKLKAAQRIKTVLFPTDFSAESYGVFQSVITFAKRLDAELVLFHQMEYLSLELGYPFLVPAVSQASLGEMRREATQKLERWASEARASGVRVGHDLGADAFEPAQAIVRAAAKRPSCVIALASQSGRAERLLLGSVSRKVLRTAVNPVYILHPVAPGERSTSASTLLSVGYLATLG